jgi:formylglycine-generating enzyme required for sulfatase activity
LAALYRLLSETEREYVTRAGTTTPFRWGSSITPKQANYDRSAEPYEGGGSKGEFRQRTVPVDSFKANPWGLYQVHGNVREWTEDCWNDSNTGNPGNGSARTTGDCSRRILRGGSWFNLPRILRAANRIGDPTVFRSSFRLARTLEPVAAAVAPEGEEVKREAWKSPLDRALTAAEEERLKPGDEFQECKDCPRIVVPAGDFTMGSPSDEAELWNPDRPFHSKVVADLKQMAPSLSIELIVARVQTPDQVLSPRWLLPRPKRST